jgi:hypothetical protein
VRDFGGRQLFLTLAIADSFALATHACIVQQLLRSHGCVSDAADSPWLGLHRVHIPMQCHSCRTKTTNENNSLENELVFRRNTKTNTKTTTKRVENVTVNVPNNIFPHLPGHHALWFTRVPCLHLSSLPPERTKFYVYQHPMARLSFLSP